MIGIWLRATLGRLRGPLLGAVGGIGLTIALLAAIAAFISSSSAALTRNAFAAVPVDWQVQRNPGAAPREILRAIGDATQYRALERAWYANVAGFEASSGGTVQTTGPGKVVGLQRGYRRAFPHEVTRLIGASNGVLVFSQTAANLHVRPGDMITIKRIGLPAVRVRADAVVTMPHIDSFFQAVGLPAGAAPQAPPDNVLLMPERRWHALFDRERIVRPDSVREQFHVGIARETLPADPLAAYDTVVGRAHNVEARIAGSGVVGDNLAAALLGAQADALYARVLFLFLGIPGAVLAVLLTLAIAASAEGRRRGEEALLRLRGASTSQLIALSATEGVVIGVAGAVVGLTLYAAVDRPAGIGPAAWAVSALGFLIALAVVLIPAWVQASRTTVASARLAIGRPPAPLWQRIGLDYVFIGISVVVFWRTAAGGYQIVLAPEGVPQTTVHYDSFLAPLLLWVGVALFSMRAVRLLLHQGRPALTLALTPITRGLRHVVAAYLERQQIVLARTLVLVVLAFSFAVSTAVFNSTYNAQSRIDAELTNGSDVTVFGTPAAPAALVFSQLRSISGVIAAVTMQHRLAYVGNDLQDLYGINPRTIGSVTPMSNAFFGNNDASTTLATLAAHPDGVLVSQETVQTYRLRLGDSVTFRLQNARTHQYEPVHFRFVGISREFPTAPKDSFLVANASYIARSTGSSNAEDVLMRAATESSIPRIAAAARRIAEPLGEVQVRTILQAQQSIGSSLTALNLHGLTAIELGFAVICIAAATGLLLVLGFSERIRLFGILTAIGADARQLRTFLWGEAVLVVATGGLLGGLLGVGVAQMLVKMLTGVFDPPPSELTVPWAYIAAVAAAAGISTWLAVLFAAETARRRALWALRTL